MSLLPAEDTIGLDPGTHEPFFWRGWHDRERCLDGRTYVIRTSQDGGKNYAFDGYPVVTICGRQTAPFRLIPRYVDLFLYRTSHDTYLCHRRWVSEAYGEIPNHYDFVETDTLDAMRDALLNYDPTEHAKTLWSEDDPLNAKRARRAKTWLREQYHARVELLVSGARRAA